MSLSVFHLLGLPIHLTTHAHATETVLNWTRQPGPARTVVTINPEIFVQSTGDPDLTAAVRRADLVTVDGVGVDLALRLRRAPIPERVLGIELIQSVMAAGGAQLKVYFYGAAPGVAAEAARICQQKHGIQVAGVRDGYGHAPISDIMEDIRTSGANLVLTALGCPLQETFNDMARSHLQGGVLIGVGGSLDVIAGHAPRAPRIYSRLGLEFVWRIVKLKRWQRSKRLLQFVRMALLGSPVPG